MYIQHVIKLSLGTFVHTTCTGAVCNLILLFYVILKIKKIEKELHILLLLDL